MRPHGSVLATVLLGASVLALSAGTATAEMSAAAPASKGDLAGITKVLDRQVKDGSIPGAVVYVAEGGKQSYFEAVGKSDIAAQRPITRDDIFRFYSMSKPITCAAVLTLYDAGRIGLDDPVKKYLPEFAHMQVRTPAGIVAANRDITVRDLMTHTSGLSYEVIGSSVSEDYRQADVFAIRNRTSEDLAHHVTRLAKLPLASQPGQAWNYGESMGVLGRIIEVASGTTYRAYLKEHLLSPLQMNDTDFFVPAEKASRLAQLYTKDAAGPLTSAADAAQYGGSYLVQPRLEYGGAGLVGTPNDYMNFAQMLLHGGTFGGRTVLSEAAVKMMITNQLPPALGDQALAGRPPGTGFGFCGSSVISRNAESPPGSVGEYGWGGWASTTFWIDPKRDLAGLIFTQVIPNVIGASTLGSEVREVIYAPSSR